MHQTRNFVPNNREVVSHSSHRPGPPSWRSIVKKGYSIKARHPVSQRRLDLVAVDAPWHRRKPVVRGSVQARKCEPRIPARDDVENHFRRGEPAADFREQYSQHSWLEIHQQALGDDKYGSPRIDGVHPNRVKNAGGDMAKPIGGRKKALPQEDCLWQIDRYPAHPAVVDAVSLGFQALAKRHHNPVWMASNPVSQDIIDSGCPRSEQAAWCPKVSIEIVVERLVDAHAARIIQNAIPAGRLHCSIMQRPQHGVRHARKVRRDLGGAVGCHWTPTRHSPYVAVQHAECKRSSRFIARFNRQTKAPLDAWGPSAYRIPTIM